ncbi:MAG: lauroyl acyltransferase [Alphaproteobacteria bacterium]|nr:lauroyl acyltransferase [Alphaproteobacteria bacterium]
MLRKIRRLFIYALTRFLFGTLRLLPLDAASAIGGWLGRTLGPLLPFTRRADTNLQIAFPAMPKEERDRIVRAMWDNLGRTFAEFPHLDTREMSTRIHVEGTEIVDAFLASGKPGIFISGHFANWEIIPKTAADYGISLQLVYRPANNPYVDALVQRMRGATHGGLVAKGRRTGMAILQFLKEGKHIGMLVDQKMNQGIAVPFFGHDAMTSPVVVTFALRREAVVLPVWVERTKGCRFTLHVHPPLEIPATGDREKDIYNGTAQINALLESWIRRDPKQWFWLHRRWGKMATSAAV